MVIDNILDEVVGMSRSDKVNYLRDYYMKETVDNLDDEELFEKVCDLMWENHPDYQG
tara:strand:- start:80 stop:250 length:171 start_codon:yes stop_codon:yes gene_type:complete